MKKHNPGVWSCGVNRDLKQRETFFGLYSVMISNIVRSRHIVDLMSPRKEGSEEGSGSDHLLFIYIKAC